MRVGTLAVNMIKTLLPDLQVYSVTKMELFRFLVEKDGSISKVEVVRSLDPACDKEAIRLIRLLPKFIPAKQNGVNVSVWYTLPITFKLE